MIFQCAVWDIFLQNLCEVMLKYYVLISLQLKKSHFINCGPATQNPEIVTLQWLFRSNGKLKSNVSLSICAVNSHRKYRISTVTAYYITSVVLYHLITQILISYFSLPFAMGRFGNVFVSRIRMNQKDKRTEEKFVFHTNNQKIKIHSSLVNNDVHLFVWNFDPSSHVHVCAMPVTLSSPFI